MGCQLSCSLDSAVYGCCQSGMALKCRLYLLDFWVRTGSYCHFAEAVWAPSQMAPRAPISVFPATMKTRILSGPSWLGSD